MPRARMPRAATEPLYLFSYGSNHPDQMRERLGRNFATEGAVAHGQSRVFRGYSQNWGGGVASLEPSPSAATYGLVARVTPHDLATMDRYEGVAGGHYARTIIDITLQDGRRAKAVAYISLSREFNPPSDRYLNAIAKTVGTHWSGANGPVTAADITVRSDPNTTFTPRGDFEVVVDGTVIGTYSTRAQASAAAKAHNTRRR